MSNFVVMSVSRRIEWIDALRGFAMILVVMFHVALRYDAHVALPSTHFFNVFHLPLFFFVSGFVAYKGSREWTAGEYVRLILKKTRALLVPLLVFLPLYGIVMFPDFWAWMEETVIHTPSKGGYWYLTVLFYMLCIYYTMNFVARRCGAWADAVLAVVAVAVYLMAHTPSRFPFLYSDGRWAGWLWDTSLVYMVAYFPFFMAGALCHRYRERCVRAVSNRWLSAIVIGVAVVLAVIRFGDFSCGWANYAAVVSVPFFGVAVVVMAFYTYRDSFSAGTPAGRLLQHIGARTLDVYVLHFFFVPMLVPVGCFFDANPHAAVIEGVLSLTISMAVIGVSLLVSGILRISPLLRRYIFNGD